MNTRSFTVVDESHTASGSSLQQLCDHVENAIAEYIKILNTVTTEAAKAGQTTRRYEAYAAMISGIQGNFSRLGSTLSQAAENYVSEIDAADGYLY